MLQPQIGAARRTHAVNERVVWSRGTKSSSALIVTERSACLLTHPEVKVTQLLRNYRETTLKYSESTMKVLRKYSAVTTVTAEL